MNHLQGLLDYFLNIYYGKIMLNQWKMCVNIILQKIYIYI